jgi:hypothetical protein
MSVQMFGARWCRPGAREAGAAETLIRGHVEPSVRWCVFDLSFTCTYAAPWPDQRRPARAGEGEVGVSSLCLLRPGLDRQVCGHMSPSAISSTFPAGSSK